MSMNVAEFFFKNLLFGLSKCFIFSTSLVGNSPMGLLSFLNFLGQQISSVGFQEACFVPRPRRVAQLHSLHTHCITVKWCLLNFLCGVPDYKLSSDER